MDSKVTCENASWHPLCHGKPSSVRDSKQVKPLRQHPIALHRDHRVGAGLPQTLHGGLCARGSRPEEACLNKGNSTGAGVASGVPSAFCGGHQRELMQEGLTDPINWVPSGSGGWEIECQPSYPPPSHEGLPTPARVF